MAELKEAHDDLSAFCDAIDKAFPSRADEEPHGADYATRCARLELRARELARCVQERDAAIEQFVKLRAEIERWQTRIADVLRAAGMEPVVVVAESSDPPTGGYAISAPRSPRVHALAAQEQELLSPVAAVAAVAPEPKGD